MVLRAIRRDIFHKSAVQWKHFFSHLQVTWYVHQYEVAPERVRCPVASRNWSKVKRSVKIMIYHLLGIPPVSALPFQPSSHHTPKLPSFHHNGTAEDSWTDLWCVPVYLKSWIFQVRGWLCQKHPLMSKVRGSLTAKFATQFGSRHRWREKTLHDTFISHISLFFCH